MSRRLTRPRAWLGALLLAAALLSPSPAGAHRLWPSYLLLELGEGGLVDVFWKLPVPGGAPLALTPSLPAHCAALTAPVTLTADRASRTRWRADCGQAGLVGQVVSVAGLAETGSDVVVRVVHPGGGEVTGVLHPDAPSMTVPAPGEALPRWGYLGVGAEHILAGPDHLLFVAGLLLVVGWRARQLLATITAFTAAHSVTLGLASLGLLRFPQASVEAIIALSILFLAVEAAGEDPAASLSARRPWLVAGACGLIHGLGFAGALSQLGLPRDGVLGALLLFNLGVEAGQLFFVAAALAGALALRRAVCLERLRPVAVYALGAVSAFWVIQRSVAILG